MNEGEKGEEKRNVQEEEGRKESLKECVVRRVRR